MAGTRLTGRQGRSGVEACFSKRVGGKRRRGSWGSPLSAVPAWLLELSGWLADPDIAAARPQHPAVQSAARPGPATRRRPYRPPPGAPPHRIGGPAPGTSLGVVATTAGSASRSLRLQRTPRRLSVAARGASQPVAAPARLPPRISRCPPRAGAMRLGPRPAALGLLLLCAAAAGAGKAEELHYPLGERRSDYDREALLGVQEDVDEYVKLGHEEQQKRLQAIIKKIDLDSDGFLTESELSSWIQMSFKHYAMQEAKQQFVEYDKNGDDTVTWDEYNIQMYDRVIDFDENTALDDAEEESFRKLHLKDKKRFEKANQDSGPGLSLEEFIAFEHPEEVDYMTEFVIQEALEEHDKNGDGFVSLEEFLGDYRWDPTANEDPEWILVEKDRFVNDYDKDNDGRLDPQELLPWVVPNNQGIAQEEALHLIDEMDLNGDKKLSEEEILENPDLFLTSEATDYGRQLHDDYFYHDEL
uniref:Reticulocalbin-2 n=1 Tax=Mandrillus leucophaeus TaxID=9568 RepID=A0A2K5ZP85_MANLE